MIILMKICEGCDHKNDMLYKDYTACKKCIYWKDFESRANDILMTSNENYKKFLLEKDRMKKLIKERRKYGNKD